MSKISKQNIQPSFQSKGKVYQEEIGETAVLLCKVQNLGK